MNQPAISNHPAAPWPGSFYPASSADLDDAATDAAYKAALDAIPDTDAAKDRLDARIEVLMYAMDCGIGCVLPISDAACIACELGYTNFADLALHHSATSSIRDGYLYLMPIA